MNQPPAYGLQDGWVWVRGPWDAIKPSDDIDEVIDQLCPALMQLERATARDYGQEYCGGLYSIGDGLYYSSVPSPLGPWAPAGAAKLKACKPPAFIRDDRGEAFILADFHSHPWTPSPLSPEDATAFRQLYSIRIQFDTSCRVMKLIPYLEEHRPGEVYERRGKSWKLIGIIKPEHKLEGVITPVEG